MDVSTLAGIVVGIAFIIVGIIINGTLQSFYDLPSIMIVLGDDCCDNCVLPI